MGNFSGRKYRSDTVALQDPVRSVNGFLDRLNNNIEPECKPHQIKFIELNRTKLIFYSRFKKDTKNSSDCYDVIKNMKEANACRLISNWKPRLTYRNW